MRHLFTGSSAQYRDGVLTVHCLYGTDMLGELKCAQTMEKLIKSQLKADVAVVFEDDSNIEEMERKKAEELRHMTPPTPQPVQTAYVPVPEPEEEEESAALMGKDISAETPIEISDIGEDGGRVVTEGEILSTDSRELKSGKTLLSFFIADNRSAYSCKGIFAAEQGKKDIGQYKKENVRKSTWQGAV